MTKDKAIVKTDVEFNEQDTYTLNQVMKRFCLKDHKAAMFKLLQMGFEHFQDMEDEEGE
jgi:hypothetical protein